jgi:transposase InsO family protein
MAYEYYRLACKKLSTPFNKYDFWRKTAKTLALSKTACQRLEWLIFYHDKARGNAKLACRHFAIHRSRFYYWLKRFNETNLRTLESQSAAPLKKRQRQITPKQEQQAIALRKRHLHWGKVKLAKVYEEENGEKLSSWQFQQIIKIYHLYPKPVKNARTQEKRQKAIKRKRIAELKVKIPRLGWLLHFDTIEICWNGLRRYIITVIDEFTKIAFARMYASKNSASASDFLLRINYLLDWKIANAHQDNGSEFQRYFKDLCQRLNIKQYYSRPRTPKDNPSLERFNQTLQYEWLNDGHFTTDINLFNANLKDFIIEYNFKRPHESLNYLTPIQFAVKYKQLSERYSSCTSPGQERGVMLNDNFPYLNFFLSPV